MKKKNLSLTLITMLLLGGIIYSCNQKVSSQPNFIFKSAPKEGVIAKVLGEEISEEELFKGIEGDLYEAEMKLFQLKIDKLKAYLLEKYMDKDPNKKGMSNDEYLEKTIAKGQKPTAKDIENFIKEKDIPAQHVNDQLKERITAFLDQEFKRKAMDSWLNDQIKKNPVEVYVTKPQRPVFDVRGDNGPSYGPANAKVTVVEFSDFPCPYCARGASIVSQIKKEYGNKVRVVFKNFPLPFHQHARLAAEASLCANDQGEKEFWKFHDSLFAEQDKLTKVDLMEKAKKQGLKMDQFEKCLEGHQFATALDSQIKDGEKAGIKSTPTFFVNGQLINGAQPFEVFAELIDEELNK